MARKGRKERRKWQANSLIFTRLANLPAGFEGEGPIPGMAERAGYPGMCDHGTIGVAVTLACKKASPAGDQKRNARGTDEPDLRSATASLEAFLKEASNGWLASSIPASGSALVSVESELVLDRQAGSDWAFASKRES